jgi:N-acetylglutamate synthase-like GNAT family acetyltransferase/ferredoxin
MAAALRGPVELLVARGGGPDLEEVRLRRARADDAAALHELTRPFVDAGSAPAREAPSCADPAEDHLLVECSGTAVAAVGIRRADGDGELYGLVVDQDWQGAGLGRLLVAAALQSLAAEGVAQVRVVPGEAGEWFTALGFTAPDATAAAPAGLCRPTALDGHDLPSAAGQLGGLRVDFRRSGVQHGWDPAASALLQFARRRGVRTESQCWAGVCGTCSVRITSGTVTYDDEPGFEPDDGKVLLCITRPLTDLALEL